MCGACDSVTSLFLSIGVCSQLNMVKFYSFGSICTVFIYGLASDSCTESNCVYVSWQNDATLDENSEAAPDSATRAHSARRR